MYDQPVLVRGELVSLWSFMEFVWAFVSAVQRLRDAQQRYARMPGTAKLSADQKRFLRSLLQYLEKNVSPFELDAALDRLQHVRRCIAHSGTLADLNEQLEVLSETIEDQFARRYCVNVPIVKVKFARDFLSIFPESIVKAFPSISGDVIEACECYALDRNSASVFHSMGILQRGLYALADDLHVEFKEGIELENWKNIIDQIEAKIRSLEAMKKGKEKDAQLTFYSEAAVQFRYFKDAWRNHVAHQREEYDADQAHSVLIHVRDFMAQLAGRLKEVATKPSTE